ncbi:Antitoxin VapB [Frankia canadensis]|uniref:Antitoxin VapB n=1 Tax=Frankia canadensis TaxID=1836972 RepID=A0A2I2KRT9_9ACTN|nr:type II toxin-antitoxin system VapB family antitoxin [Frankia canadensis]SNQ48384.1 Antitoxin VapB [Frankia canadensis]SOU55674.1 Antitoxin VapB [Frankia canadensis]
MGTLRIRQTSAMALTIDDPATEQLAADVAALTGETTTKAITVALRERRARLTAARAAADRRARLLRFLADDTQPQTSPDEREEILGHGPPAL